MCADVTPDGLSAEDARILALETERIAGHTLKVMVLEHGATLSLEELREWVGSRVGRLPRLTQRVELPPGGGPPSWVADRDFALTTHVRGTDGAETLAAAIARIMEERLDRRTPLWSIELLDGAADGSAVVLKVHHALADGTGARRIASALLWERDESAPPSLSGPAEVSAAPGRWQHGRQLVAALERELAPAVPRSALAHRVGPGRVVAFASVPLSALQPLKRAFAARVTVNDLVLAATAGGLRRWLEHVHERPQAMRVKVPVSLHRPDEERETLGNADSFFFVDLPVTEPDPERRLRAIAQQCSARKRTHDAQQLASVLGGIATRSPAAGRAALHWSMSPHVFTLNVSNVPGPRGPLSVCGRPLRGVYSLAEIADWHALRIAVFSACGRLSFGLCGDAEHVGALETLAQEIETEFTVLAARADANRTARSD